MMVLDIIRLERFGIFVLAALQGLLGQWYRT